MKTRRVALIYDNQYRPETTGFYCQRALEELLGEVVHFLPGQVDKIPRTGFDLYLNIDDGLRYRLPNDLRPCAWWVIDTHMDADWAEEKGRDFDWLFAAQRDGADRLVRSGLPAQWLPLGCDPRIHKPHNVAKRWDVCFVGWVRPGPRQEMITLVQQHFPNSFIGQKYFDEYAKTCSESRIGINCSVRNDINMRVFETLACGTLLVTNDLRNSGQEELFNSDKHLVTYQGGDELVDKLRFYIDHGDARERIAQAGYAEAVARHTYRHRMRSLLQTIEAGFRCCGVPPKSSPPAFSSGAQPSATIAVPKSPSDRLPIQSIQPETDVPGAPAARPLPDKDASYFDFPRPEVAALIPFTATRVLDIGCGAGALGALLKERQPAEVVGIELQPAAAALARQRLDQVLERSVEDHALEFEPGRFDCIVCADVLEHLREPAQVLAKIRRWLTPGGTLVASLPNMRHHSIVGALIEGNWTYEMAGLLDSDHVRFFTRREIEKLFYRTGFEIQQLQGKPGSGYEEWQQAGCPGEVRIGSMSISGLSSDITQ